jgi:hypothetical protein
MTAKSTNRKSKSISLTENAQAFEPALVSGRRAERFVDVIVRSAIPVVGVLFLQYNAAQMLLVFLVDTWMTLVAVSALQTLLTQRSANHGAGNGRSVFANYFDALGSSVLVISFLMIPVLAPALFVLSFGEGLSVLRSTASFWPLVATNAAAVFLSFFIQSVTMQAAPTTENLLKQRFLIAFFRWFAVVALLFVGGAVVDSTVDGDGRVFAVLSVIVYCGFSVYAECYPEHIARIPHFLQTGRWQR